jgi:polysaccharide export outer membrane protein
MENIKDGSFIVGLRRFINVFFLILALGLFFFCSSSPKRVKYNFSLSPQVDTTLGPGDIFDVRVYGEKELSNIFRVSSAGTIDFPLIGKVKVQGLTPSEVAELLKKRLKEGEFVKDPHISIFVREYKSKKISVFGQVQRPGTFNYEDNMNVVQAITLAGGFTPLADKNRTTVTRTLKGKKQRIRVPVEKIGRGTAVNFLLLPGDIIFVPERIF